MTFQTDVLAALAERRMRYFAWRLTRDQDDAEDLLQDTFVRAVRYEDHFQPGSNLGAWLTTMCRNLHLQHQRRAWRSVEMFEDFDTPMRESQLDYVVLGDLQAAIHDRLTAEDAEMLCLQALDGEPYEALAARYGMPVGTIKSRLYRSRQKLKDFQ